jgi:uncharacterized protein (DUF608 family)
MQAIKPAIVLFSVVSVLVAASIVSAAGKTSPVFTGPTAEMVDTSHGLGIPFGGIGTGCSVFGKYGFVHVLFDGRHLDSDMNGDWRVTRAPKIKPTFAWQLSEGDKTIVLQESGLDWLPTAQTVDQVRAYADLPKGHFVFEKAGWNLGLVMTAFSPMTPHDLANSTLPVQVFDFTVENKSAGARTLQLGLVHRDPLQTHGKMAVLESTNGATAFACDGGTADAQGVSVTLKLAPGKRQTVRFYIAWYYPEFTTTSPVMPQPYRRYYAKRFKNAGAVIDLARKSADGWSVAIDRWHAAYDVPPAFKRLWFSSLSSVIASTSLSDDPYFFEQEMPHPWINTMDVCVYNNWLYLVNWPELERMDMNQYFQAIPKTGDQAGFVWHSLWSDASAYAEEPTFIGRIYRDSLWFNNPRWTDQALPVATLAANCAYGRDHYQYLLHNREGNQSYDLWKMPGVNAYVNVMWVYALYSLDQMAQAAHQPARVGDLPVAEMFSKARQSLDDLLWNPSGNYWNTFYVPTNRAEDPDALRRTDGQDTFSDQLFGKWLTRLDPQAESVLPPGKVSTALHAVYVNNLIDDPAKHFRGWANGMKPGHQPDLGVGNHCQTAWFGPQETLASLLADAGNEAESLDVFNSLEASLHDNHLYVGEWNQSVGPDGMSRLNPGEPHKDTPRFPPYPRYKSCWEYLAAILGLKMDAQNFYLKPFTTIDFALNDVELAGTRFTIQVQSGWTRILVDGRPQNGPLRLPRDHRAYHLQFLK